MLGHRSEIEWLREWTGRETSREEITFECEIYNQNNEFSNLFNSFSLFFSSLSLLTINWYRITIRIFCSLPTNCCFCPFLCVAKRNSFYSVPTYRYFRTIYLFSPSVFLWSFWNIISAVWTTNTLLSVHFDEVSDTIFKMVTKQEVYSDANLAALLLSITSLLAAPVSYSIKLN